MLTDIADALRDAYGVHAAELHHILAGTNTVNYRVVDENGRRWFAKIYRGDLERERAAIELTEFARDGEVPVPAVRRTLDRDVLCARVPMSLWEFVDGETAEGGLAGARWQAVGTVLGRLHRRLAEHPAAPPTRQPAVGVRDVSKAPRSFDRIIDGYASHTRLRPFEQWAWEAAKERRGLLDRASAILAELPVLTVQIVHGDLASPNLMLRGDEVAAVIDFQPPSPRFIAWEIARIGCDPRTVMLGDDWIDGLADLLLAYRGEHPAAHVDDLVSSVATGCAYTLASTYPLAEPLDDPSAVTPSLELYARARHETALVMLERLPDVQDRLRERLRSRP
ncbi:aminoglycoside phosphotransferase [Kribbella speibonae]|uniref:Aminoglycoside phosphotransferase n=1 Tax=Kribbella speibonae TaxID=1572660 RepID=A0A4R0JAD9_9ACTN|nr:aminoglycoside phosphotransferase [Kribbella speibonae]